MRQGLICFHMALQPHWKWDYGQNFMKNWAVKENKWLMRKEQ